MNDEDRAVLQRIAAVDQRAAQMGELVLSRKLQAGDSTNIEAWRKQLEIAAQSVECRFRKTHLLHIAISELDRIEGRRDPR